MLEAKKALWARASKQEKYLDLVHTLGKNKVTLPEVTERLIDDTENVKRIIKQILNEKAQM